MAKITFLGATGTVTGSKYCVEANGKRLLIDCGLFQGGSDLRQRNWQPLPIAPGTMDWVVLTHAHIDHTGYLPRLVGDGFRGPIYANSATQDLCNILLTDSAHIQEEDAAIASQGGFSSHPQPLPLYTVAEAQAALQRFKAIPRDAAFAISSEFSVRGYDAGHIIGSSSLELTITEGGRSIVVVFSGDIGRYDQPILKNPQTPPRADYLLCESTYGDRDHPGGSPLDALGDVVARVVKRGGVIVIPSFAVGRVQLLLYMLRELADMKRIPHIPLYVDSPMAISATQLYLSHHEDHTAEFTREETSGDPLGMQGVHLTRTAQESKEINKINSPCIILSASGMATGGRVLFHLARRLPDSRNAVILPGYQAEGTRGRALADGARTVNIHGINVPVNAEVCVLPQFSAHAGQSELLRWLSGISAPPRQTFMVHGEPGPAAALRAKIEQQLHWNVVQPAYAQSFDLTV